MPMQRKVSVLPCSDKSQRRLGYRPADAIEGGAPARFTLRASRMLKAGQAAQDPHANRPRQAARSCLSLV